MKEVKQTRLVFLSALIILCRIHIPIQAQTNFTDDYYIVSSVLSGKILDISGNSFEDNNPVIQWFYNGQDNQKWKLKPSGEKGCYYIVSKLTGKCFDIVNDQDNAILVQNPVENKNTRKWELVHTGNNFYLIVSVSNGQALTLKNDSMDDSTNLVLEKASKKDSQLWKFWADGKSPCDAKKKADDAYSQGKYDDALKYYREAIKIDKTYGDAYKGAGITLYYRLNKISEGIEYLKTAVSLMKDNPYPVAELGYALAYVPDYDNAIKAMDQSILLCDTLKISPPAWVYTEPINWCLWSMKEKKPLLAISYCKALLERDYDTDTGDTGLEMLVWSYKEAKMWDEFLKAVVQYQDKGIKDYKKGEVCLEAALYYSGIAVNDPEKAKSWFASSVKHYDRAIEKAPENERAELYYNRGKVQLKSGNNEEAYNDFKKAYNLDPKTERYLNNFVDASNLLGYLALADNNYPKTLSFAEPALKAKPDDDRSKRLSWFAKEHPKYAKVKPDYVHQALALYIKNTDVKDAVDLQGQKISYRGSMTEKQIRDSYIQQKILKIYLETLTKGSLSISFDARFTDAAIRDVEKIKYNETDSNYVYIADIDFVSPEMGSMLFKSRNKFDTVFYYWTAGDFLSIAFGGARTIPYIPYLWDGAYRGYVNMPAEFTSYDYDMLLLHEFWHVIGTIHEVGPGHAWYAANIDEARKKYPGWKDRTELGWYQYQLENTIPGVMDEKAAKTGLSPSYRNFNFCIGNYDRFDDRLLPVYYFDKIKNIPVKDLKTAWELYGKAKELQDKKETDKAISLYEKILTINPYYHKVLWELGNAMLLKKDFKRADTYFSAYAEIFPDTCDLFTIGKAFLENSRNKEALSYFKTGYTISDKNPGFNYWIAKTLKADDNDKEADALLNEMKELNVKPDASGIITFTAGYGRVISETGDPQAFPDMVDRKFSIVYWVRPEDKVVWYTEIPKPEKYQVEIEYACPDDQSGSTVLLRSGDQSLRFLTSATGSWNSSGTFTVKGYFSLKAGKREFTIQPENIRNYGLMNLVQIRLIPVR